MLVNGSSCLFPLRKFRPASGAITMETREEIIEWSLFLPLILAPPHPEAKPGKDCLSRLIFSVGHNSFVRKPSSPHLTWDLLPRVPEAKNSKLQDICTLALQSRMQRWPVCMFSQAPSQTSLLGNLFFFFDHIDHIFITLIQKLLKQN